MKTVLPKDGRFEHYVDYSHLPVVCIYILLTNSSCVYADPEENGVKRTQSLSLCLEIKLIYVKVNAWSIGIFNKLLLLLLVLPLWCN